MALLTKRAPPDWRWRGLRRWAALLGLALATLPGPVATTASATTSISDEYQLKAVFLFNFAQFVDWPANAFPNAKAPFVIGVLGLDPFGSYLDELVSGEKVGDRPLVIRRFAHVEDLTDCHILFVSRSEAPALEKVLAALRGRSVLTISDAEGFARRGGMVRFVTENGKIRLRINLEAATTCGLKISSKIMRPSMIVASGKD